MRRQKSELVGTFMWGAACFAALVGVSWACAAAPVAKVATSELRTICKAAEQQPEPDYVLFTCDLVDATGIAVNTFAVKAPTKTAPAFRAAHARAPVDAGHTD